MYNIGNEKGNEIKTSWNSDRKFCITENPDLSQKVALTDRKKSRKVLVVGAVEKSEQCGVGVGSNRGSGG